MKGRVYHNKYFVVCYAPALLEAFLKDYAQIIQRYAYIKHNKDSDSNGEIKKEHFHLLLEMTTRKDGTWLADCLGISETGITKHEYVHNWQYCEAYLLHRTPDSCGQYQYDISEVVSNYDFKEPILQERRTDDEIMTELCEMAKEARKMSEFLTYVFSKGAQYIECYEKHKIIKDIAYFSIKESSTKGSDPKAHRGFFENLCDDELMSLYRRELCIKTDCYIKAKPFDTLTLDNCVREAQKRGLLLAEGLEVSQDFGAYDDADIPF